MKVSSATAARFVAELSPNIAGVLLYGPDHGLKHTYARAMLSTRGEITELRGEAVQQDPALLHDSAYGSSLFAALDVNSGSAIWLREVGERTLPAIEATLGSSDSSRNLIVVEAGELTSKSKLRAFFESHAHLAAIGCYAETGEALAKTLREAAAAQKARFNTEALDYIVGRMPPDREAQLQELQKLLTYIGVGAGSDGKTEITITLKDVMATIGDAAEEDVYDLPWQVFGGEGQTVDRALMRLAGEGTSEIQILRALLSHALKLHQAQSLIESGQNQGQALSAIRPPLYDRDRQRLGAQLRRWRLPQLGRAISAINEAERQAKSTGYPAGTILGQLCLQLSQV